MRESTSPDAPVVVVEPTKDAPFVITCEHAGVRLPPPWTWPDEDAWLTTTHWAYDIGVREWAVELAARTGAGVVMANFSRLLIDPNRPLDSPTLFRERAEQRPVVLNQAITDSDRAARVSYWEAFHEAVDGMLGRVDCAYVLALHSFTPLYEGQPRKLELGVLFDRAEEKAVALARQFETLEWHIELNQPYSGREGLIYSAERHAQAHDRQAIELELRQDLAVDPERRAELIEAIAAADW